MGPAAAWIIPSVLGIGGAVAQNQANKANIKNQNNAQASAQANTQQAQQAALANLMAWLKANPSPVSGMPPISMPSSIGGGVMGNSGWMQPPPGGQTPGTSGPNPQQAMGGLAVRPMQQAPQGGAGNDLRFLLNNPQQKRMVYPA